MPIANINGVDLNYEIAGQGKAVVCVHGYTGSSQDWANQFSGLSSKYTVVTLDLRGHGKSAAPSRKEAYSISIFADDVLGLLKRLNIKRCCLIGHSLGGFIALEFTLAHQDMLAGLVLVGTSSGELVRDPGFPELMQKLKELALSQGMEAAFEYEAANNPQRIETYRKHPEQREIARKRMLTTSLDGYLYASRAITKWAHVTSRLSEINVPTLIFWGDEDVVMSKGSQTLKKGITNSELVTVKGVGHNPHWESPDFFNKTLLEFLGKINW